MRLLLSLLLTGAIVTAAFADTPVLPSVAPCAGADAASCDPPKADQRRAAELFRRGIKLKEEKRSAEAFEVFREAASLVPRNLEYVTAREIVRQQLVYDHVQAGNQLLEANKGVEAFAEFRLALQLDPTNQFAQQRARDALGDVAPEISHGLQIVAQSETVEVYPRPGRVDIHYRGDVRGLYEQIAHTFGLKVAFDESVLPRTVRFDVDRLDFYSAARLAGNVSRTFWAPLSEEQFVVAADTPEEHKQYDRMAMRTFYIPDAASNTELNDLVNTLRSVFEVRMVTVQPAQSTLVVRAPAPVLQAATDFLQAMEGGPPQVMLDIKAFNIDRTFTRALGIQLPLQFTMFNIGSSALALLGQPNIQNLINQLIAGGGINAANSEALQALLAQVQSQSQNPLLSQPFATFGGGITLFGVTIPPLTATATFNSSSIDSLEHMTLRAMQGKVATFHIGSRYPILNATFAPLLNSPQLSQVIQNGSFTAAFPSFSYEDLGLMVKATPAVHGNSDVTLKLETTLATLTGQSINGVPIISNQQYKGEITLKNGETGVVAGMLTNSDVRSLSGLPGFSHLPVVGRLTSTENLQTERSEILVVITPHIIASSAQTKYEYWLGQR